MKFALTNPDAFNQPVTAFFLGLIQCVSIWLTELCNVLKSLDQKTPQDVIVRFVGLALILTVHKMYVPSIESFEIQKAVGKLTNNRKRKEFVRDQSQITKPEQRLCCAFVFNSIYCLFKWFFVSFYFYFFPFIIVFIPLIKVTYLYSVNNEEAAVPVTA